MATEKRLICADDLMKAIRSFRWIAPPNTLKLMFEYLWIIIRDQPTVDAVEVVHGRWKSYHEADIGYDEYGVRCSNCGFEVEDNEVKFIMHYCPNCGAKMDGDGNG